MQGPGHNTTYTIHYNVLHGYHNKSSKPPYLRPHIIYPISMHLCATQDVHNPPPPFSFWLQMCSAPSFHCLLYQCSARRANLDSLFHRLLMMCGCKALPLYKCNDGLSSCALWVMLYPQISALETVHLTKLLSCISLSNIIVGNMQFWE